MVTSGLDIYLVSNTIIIIHKNQSRVMRVKGINNILELPYLLLFSLGSGNDSSYTATMYSCTFSYTVLANSEEEHMHLIYQSKLVPAVLLIATNVMDIHQGHE